MSSDPQSPSSPSSPDHSYLISQQSPPSSPTLSLIQDYATEILGMSLPTDTQFLPLAKAAYQSRLPPSYQIYKRPDGTIYYKNTTTQEKMKIHPADLYYLEMYRSEKRAVEEREGRKGMEMIDEEEEGYSSPDVYRGEEDGEEINTKQEEDLLNIPQTERRALVDKKIAEMKQALLVELQNKMESEIDQKRKAMFDSMNEIRYREEKEEEIKMQRELKTLREELEKKEAEKLQELKEMEQMLKEKRKQNEKDIVELVAKMREDISGQKILEEVHKRVEERKRKITQKYSLKLSEAKLKMSREFQEAKDMIENRADNERKALLAQQVEIQRSYQKRMEVVRRKEKAAVDKEMAGVLEGRKQKIKKEMEKKYEEKIRVLKQVMREEEKGGSELGKEEEMRLKAEEEELERKIQMKEKATKLSHDLQSMQKEIMRRKQLIQRYNLSNSILKIQYELAEGKLSPGSATELLEQFVTKHSVFPFPNSSSNPSFPSQTPLSTLLQKLQQDRNYLHSVSTYLAQSTQTSFTEKSRIRNMRIPSHQKEAKLQGIIKSNKELRKLYNIDFMSFVKNEKRVREYVEGVEKGENDFKQVERSYVELRLREGVGRETVALGERTAFFGVRMLGLGESKDSGDKGMKWKEQGGDKNRKIIFKVQSK